jgi:hypothetical protein
MEGRSHLVKMQKSTKVSVFLKTDISGALRSIFRQSGGGGPAF